ncbi:WLM domain-containing protein [Lineolata rhizophorae]|uniref:WLM domain-containing protein n=1 Tax=Lineolata rhizophorae TaxID=578093 RepID=A0A6A6P6S0_9PEZI|nr:WLM domain-containing protein [Lineolata rhizophorae]
MPLGFERLNERVQRPNALLNFIKPLDDERATSPARAVLERVAAVMYPIMKRHHIAVMALEEFPPNLEFAGRNFNAGEVIQLVLRAPGGGGGGGGGGWLSERHVQMVMIHELAHCKEMNHSRAFWKVRDQFAAELRELWAKGYTGEGMWGRGRVAGTGEMSARQGETDWMPKDLCGGTYRSSGGRRGKKRKRQDQGGNKAKLTYAERQQRRIRRKFGEGGMLLGAEEDMKAKLEGGKRVKGKPKVASSSRGRELRAAAALARFEQTKSESKGSRSSDEDTDAESEYEDGTKGYEDESEAAVDFDGSRMHDEEGQNLIKVCEGEDDGDDVRREMYEIRGIDGRRIKSEEEDDTRFQKPKIKPEKVPRLRTTEKKKPSKPPQPNITFDKSSEKPLSGSSLQSAPATGNVGAARSSKSKQPTCPICSLANEQGALTCAACAHVLDTNSMKNCWKCKSLACQRGAYINAGDCGICGVCGAPKP